MTKNSYLKTRCTEKEKYRVQQYVQGKGISESDFILASVRAAMHYTTPKNMELDFYYHVQCNILRNQILNQINLDPNIPAKTKNKILEVIDEYDFSPIDVY